MNTITTSSNTVTMSSREIAELTGKQHKDVIRDVRAMRKALESDGADLRHLHEIKDGRDYTAEFRLDRLLTETLLTGYSIPLRYRVVTRLSELENVSRQVVTVPQTLPEALRLAADQAEHNLQLQAVIQKQAPKVEALNRLANTHGSVCITNAAKQLGVAPMRLFAWLSDNRWIYRRASHASWSAFQPRLSSGLLEHKLVKVGGDPEELKVVEQVMVTRRGITTLAEQILGTPL
ncbi:phage antirepressor KilAC domain-containing protein [Pseudomonas sp. RTC3]|uniref:phage antirepressor KilAC domain-containing protein n=1 Tax=Pseudomonas sp. 5C2 TaxID=3048588 RepID=UPI002AB40882|nr:phage antirepressor KilAC domain-containing protein [Pseudomonas sp. 5C2]MDY7565810.1 phage antirepressor KilAC domain-containing protein [Pseudomonas sp. 5C2]MEB0062479.1 phage antirepressor KilAC domain-containing protein [Pseudomonas sp. RTC3]MEB0240484.1 phage antirepressor KilAC domain-containing protein [Pseudomonas sp. 5C2]